MLGVGGIGIVIPVWPTTPFVLIAAACFVKGSPALYEKLNANPYFGEFLKNYKDKRGVKKSIKIKSLIFLWISLGISLIITQNMHVAIVLLIVGITVTIHIACIKTRKKDIEWHSITGFTHENRKQ